MYHKRSIAWHSQINETLTQHHPLVNIKVDPLGFYASIIDTRAVLARTSTRPLADYVAHALVVCPRSSS
eukprot:COSAG02_NODE_1891_length_10485_cov_3.034469_5_plen_69_part_00